MLLVQPETTPTLRHLLCIWDAPELIGHVHRHPLLVMILVFDMGVFDEAPAKRIKLVSRSCCLRITSASWIMRSCSSPLSLRFLYILLIAQSISPRQVYVVTLLVTALLHPKDSRNFSNSRRSTILEPVLLVEGGKNLKIGTHVFIDGR